jgi:transaldolase
VKTGRFDWRLTELMNGRKLSDHDAAWTLNDEIVSAAQQVFWPAWDATHGDDGYVSFEIDPLLEDPACKLSQAERVAQYVELGTQWNAGHQNRMIKVPATPAGLGALEALAAAGVPLNVTLIFSMRQYEAARDAVWRGAQRRKSLDLFKSVYSIFISRVDVYTEKHVPELSPAAQGQVGIVNVKQIWRANQKFWGEHRTPIKQEIVFASTGTKKPSDPPWKYVEALVGSDIQTNPPATNEAVEKSGRTFARTIDQMPAAHVVAEIEAKVDPEHLERTLMEEGLAKFAQPQKELLGLIAKKREALAGAA